eukprot:14697761-Heterocapsa_arctica.AAC.1
MLCDGLLDVRLLRDRGHEAVYVAEHTSGELLLRREVERDGPGVRVPGVAEEVDWSRRGSVCDDFVKLVLA